MPWVEKNAHRGYKKLPELHKKVQKIHLYIEKNNYLCSVITNNSNNIC